jgi:hypothetical protein
MGRGTCSLVAGAMAVLVSMGAAGAAAEASGGNTGSAALCQRGGYTNLYNARTGARFTDEVACVAYGLNGNPYSSLVVTANRACRGCLLGERFRVRAEAGVAGPHWCDCWALPQPSPR